ncbi:MAG: family 43 glycosylhydrolase [Bacteroidales bacterium]|nr:family 43 glycosylhydrolase [Bacteroidales bacterium]
MKTLKLLTLPALAAAAVAVSISTGFCARAQEPGARPAGGFGGFQMPKIEVHCSEKFADIDYAGDGQVYHKMDIYLPRMQKETYPVVVHIYGSAWFSNNSKGMADLGTIVNALLDAGYAVVTPNHRSSSDAKFPAQIQDIKGVIRYVRAHAAEYRLDPSFVAASGFSSGGHLSSLAATSGGVAELEGSVGGNLSFSSRVDAACDWSGPVDLNYMSCGAAKDSWNHGPEEAVMGFPFKGNEEHFKALDATTYVDPSDPPVVIFHGTADNVVPPCQAPHFYELLDKAGIRTELYMVEGGGHGMKMYDDKTLRAMTNFLDKVRFEKGSGNFTTGTNPLITGQFSADPTARVFEGRICLYPSHDIPTVNWNGEQPWFCMSDYHVFSSEDLTHWTDHGNIVDQKDVPWGNPTANSMWAPDCVEKDGKYYFYFPDAPKSGRGFAVGAAVADKPYGPFRIEEKQIAGVVGIDPCVLVDDDGTAYIVWSGMGFSGAKLKDNMVELDGAPVRLDGAFPAGQKEGPFLFKREGKYYLTYPWVRERGGTECLAYGMSDSPLGPYEYKGIIMKESPTGCWTNHHSIVRYKGEWYLFYHHNDFSPSFDKNRSVRLDRIGFNPDGTIIEVIPTWRGAGYLRASDELHIDRYSEIAGATVEYLDEYNLFAGWKTLFARPGDKVRFNEVDFGRNAPKKVRIRVRTDRGAVLRFSATGANRDTDIALAPSDGWAVAEAPFKSRVRGMQDLTVELVSGSAEVDWVSFR